MQPQCRRSMSSPWRKEILRPPESSRRSGSTAVVNVYLGGNSFDIATCECIIRVENVYSLRFKRQGR